MEPGQRRVVAWAAWAIGGILALFYFLRPLWQWATWDEKRGTLDLGFMRITSRPPFPGDARSVIVGLVLPIVLVAVGVLLAGRRGAED